MNVPRLRIRTLLIGIALAALVMAGVARMLRKPGRPYSSVMANFDPVAVLGAIPGVSVRGVTAGGTFNTARHDAEKEWRGTVSVPGDPSIRGTIRTSLEDYFKKANQGHFRIEGTLEGDPDETPESKTMPSHANFNYNQGEWHGEMRIWLVPDASGSGVAYAIFLREERLNAD